METNEKVIIKDIVEFFGFEQIAGNEESLKRWVIVPDINRPGFELCGFFEHTEPKRIVVIGDKEQEFIKTMSEDLQRERFRQITDAYTPMIVLSHNGECPKILKEVADSVNFPIVRSKDPTYRLMTNLVSYLDERLAPSDTLHGVLLDVYGKGVLITGESGTGKSEIALELIKRGHILIADDRVDVAKVHNTIVGHSPNLLAGMLEIRGIGIIDVAKMFGASALLPRDSIDLVIHLERPDPKTDYARVGNEEDLYTDVLGVEIPTILLPLREGRSTAVIVESAVTNFRLKETGINSSKEFENRVFKYIMSNKKVN